MKALRDLIMDGKMPDRSSRLYNGLWIVALVVVVTGYLVVTR